MFSGSSCGQYAVQFRVANVGLELDEQKRPGARGEHLGSQGVEDLRSDAWLEVQALKMRSARCWTDFGAAISGFAAAAIKGDVATFKRRRSVELPPWLH